MLFGFFVISSLIFPSPAFSNRWGELDSNEKNKISEFVQRMVEDYPEQAIGQLFMVNIHEGYNNSIHVLRRKKFSLVEEHGIGSVILQNQNFREMKNYANLEEERIDLVSNFVKHIRYRSLGSKNNKQMRNIPLFIAADFENSGGGGEDRQFSL